MLGLKMGLEDDESACVWVKQTGDMNREYEEGEVQEWEMALEKYAGIFCRNVAGEQSVWVT